jgi:hypothetical protein
MPRADYVKCRECGRHSDECGTLSHERLCTDCGRERFEQNVLQLRAHSGPFAAHHRRQCVAAWGGVLLDDLPVGP